MSEIGKTTGSPITPVPDQSNADGVEPEKAKSQSTEAMGIIQQARDSLEIGLRSGIVEMFGSAAAQETGLENALPGTGELAPPGLADNQVLPNTLDIKGHWQDIVQQRLLRGIENPGLGGAETQQPQGPDNPFSPTGQSPDLSPKTPGLLGKEDSDATSNIADVKGKYVYASDPRRSPAAGTGPSAGSSSGGSAGTSGGVDRGSTSTTQSPQAQKDPNRTGTSGSITGGTTGSTTASDGKAGDVTSDATKSYASGEDPRTGEVPAGTINDLPGEHVVQVLNNLSLGVSSKDLVWNPDVETAEGMSSNGGDTVHEFSGTYGPGARPEGPAGSTGSAGGSIPIDSDVFVTDPMQTENLDKKPGDSEP